MTLPAAALALALSAATALGAATALAAEPLLTLEQRSGSVAGPDTTTVVEVYEDGAVLVHLPAYLKAAGDYRTQLSPRELDRLLSVVGDQQLTEVSAASIAEAKSSAGAQRRSSAAAGASEVRYVITDPDATTLTIREPGGARAATRTISYLGVHNDAVAWPEVDELARLDAAVTAIAALAARGDLEELR